MVNIESGGHGDEDTLARILEGYCCVVVMHGIGYAHEEMSPKYALFKNFDENEIRIYAMRKAEEHEVILTGIEIYTLEGKLHRELQV